MSTGPLEGVRVVDLTTTVLGPYCTQLLADYGADVIKVESAEGDIVRDTGPARHPGMSALFLNLNRGKRSIVLDLKAPRGKEAMLRLIATGDVFVHNMRPSAVARLGLAYDDLGPGHPRLVYCAAYGFGQDGPYRDKPAYDDIVQGASGVAAVQGHVAGAPAFVATVLADKTTGLMASYAIMAALYSRERSGRGQAVDVPMFETMVGYTLVEHQMGLSFDPPHGPSLYQRVTSPHRRPVPTKDGYICVMPVLERHWRSALGMIGKLDLLDRPEYATAARRAENIHGLQEVLDSSFGDQTSRVWLERLEDADVPAMRVATIEDLMDDLHLVATGFFREVDHPSEGRLRVPAPPVRMSGTPPGPTLPAPRHGEHTIEVLHEIGYVPAEATALVSAGVAVDGSTGGRAPVQDPRTEP